MALEIDKFYRSRIIRRPAFDARGTIGRLFYVATSGELLGSGYVQLSGRYDVRDGTGAPADQQQSPERP